MTKPQPVKLIMGKTNVTTSGYPSEAGYVEQVNAGMQKIQKDLLYILEQTEGATPDIMWEALHPTFEKSQEYCPKDTHALVDSGYLEVVQFRGNPKVEMGYGKGGLPDYAAYVHEMVEIPHKAPTRAKFLESAINEDMFDIIERISTGYRRFMGN